MVKEFIVFIDTSGGPSHTYARSVEETKIARNCRFFLKLHNLSVKNEKNILEIFKFFDEIERSKYTDWPIDLRSVSVNCGSTTHLVQVVQAKYEPV